MECIAQYSDPAFGYARLGNPKFRGFSGFFDGLDNGLEYTKDTLRVHEDAVQVCCLRLLMQGYSVRLVKDPEFDILADGKTCSRKIKIYSVRDRIFHSAAAAEKRLLHQMNACGKSIESFAGKEIWFLDKANNIFIFKVKIESAKK